MPKYASMNRIIQVWMPQHQPIASFKSSKAKWFNKRDKRWKGCKKQRKCNLWVFLVSLSPSLVRPSVRPSVGKFVSKWYLPISILSLSLRRQCGDRHGCRNEGGHGGRHGGGQGNPQGDWHVQNHVYKAWNVLKQSVLGRSCFMRYPTCVSSISFILFENVQ